MNKVQKSKSTKSMSFVDREIEEDIIRTQRRLEKDTSDVLLDMINWDSVANAMEHGCLVGKRISEHILKSNGKSWNGLSEKDKKGFLYKVLEVYKENKMALAIVSAKDAVSTVVSINE